MIDTYFNAHCHDDFSNGALSFPDVLATTAGTIQRAYDLGLSGLAITNHESLSSIVCALHYYAQMKKDRPFTLAIGNEIYLQTQEEFKNNRDNNATTPYYHFILLAKDTEGYRQLCELSTRAWKRAFKRNLWRKVTLIEDLKEIVANNQGHLIASSACLGSRIDKLLLNEKYKEAMRYAKQMVTIFGEGNFYLEIQPAYEKDNEQSIVNRLLWQMGEKLNIPRIVTTDSHYLSKEDRFAHKIFLQSMDGDREVDDFYSTAYMMSAAELREYLSIDFNEEEIDILFDNTNVLQNRFKQYDIFHNPIIPLIPQDKIPAFHIQHYFQEYYNQFPAIKHYAYRDNIHEQYFFYQLEQGLINHIVNNSKKSEHLIDYLKRVDIELNEEIKISNALNTPMVCYYSTMSVICAKMWECESIVGCGRGSAVGFLLTYLLDISQIDCVPLGDAMPWWRHAAVERGAELADIDTDSEPSKKYAIIKKMKEFFGEDKVLNVSTFSRISSKVAIEKACRGLHIPMDKAEYMKSLIPVNRGKVTSLRDCLNGNKEKNILPVSALIAEMNNYEHLTEIALKLEGIIINRGLHAAGLCICNEPYTNYLSAMRSPDGTLCTCFDLIDAEAVSLVKFDLLTVAATQSIHRALDEMVKHGVIKWQGSLKTTYDKYLHPDVLDYDTPQMWAKINQVYGCFQWETPVAVKTLQAIQPRSIFDLSAGNSLLRLMPEGASETPVNRYTRYKNNPQEWEQDASNYGLNEEEKQIIREICGASYFMAESQESIMRLSMHPKVAGYTLKEANALRKAIAKKNEELQAKAKAQFFEWGEKNGTRQIFLQYVWEVLFAASMGYSFSSIHSYSYSVIALQELNIFYHYGAVYWNVGVLSTEAISDDEGSGGNRDYAKIAKAVYKMKKFGVDIDAPNINQSDIDFGCNPTDNKIYYGLGAIAGINNNIAQQIIQNRPYNSFQDFCHKNLFPSSLITKAKVVQLVKAGSFDCFNVNRKEVMEEFAKYLYQPKTSLTLNHVSNCKQIDLSIPKELLYPYNFSKYVISKSFFYGHHPKFKSKKMYWLDERAKTYFHKNLEHKMVEGKDWWIENNLFVICDKSLQNCLNKQLEALKQFINQPSFIQEYNNQNALIEYNDLIKGEPNENIWSFDALTYYSQRNALADIDLGLYNIDRFSDIPQEPQWVERSYKQHKYRQYVLYRICGTVIGRIDSHNVITLLTMDDEIINVRFPPERFAALKSRVLNSDNQVIETSWLNRGSLLMLVGYRRGETDFVCRNYKASVFLDDVIKIDRVLLNGSVITHTIKGGE